MDEPDDHFYQPYRARGQRLDPSIRRIAFVAGGISGFVILVALGWSGVHMGSFGPPPVITAPPGPLRVIPANPGGLVVPGANVPIMSGQSASMTAQLAPPPPPPQIAALDQAAGLNPSPKLAPAAAALATAAKTPPPPVPSWPPAVQPAVQTVQVQLAATADEQGALSIWAGLQKRFPDLLRGKTPAIIPAVVGGHSVWRLRLSGFATAGAAKTFCDTLHSKGVACLVAPF